MLALEITQEKDISDTQLRYCLGQLTIKFVYEV